MQAQNIRKARIGRVYVYPFPFVYSRVCSPRGLEPDTPGGNEHPGCPDVGCLIPPPLEGSWINRVFFFFPLFSNVSMSWGLSDPGDPKARDFLETANTLTVACVSHASSQCRAHASASASCGLPRSGPLPRVLVAPGGWLEGVPWVLAPSAIIRSSQP